MPFARPALTDLKARIQADMNGRLQGADSALRRSVVNVIATVWAGALHGVYGFLAWLAKQLMPDQAEDSYLRRWASIWGVTAKAAVPAVGPVMITGAFGSPVLVGTLLQANGLEYATTTAGSIGGDGTGLVSVEAQTPGVAGNVDAGARLTFVSPVAGVAAEAIVQAPGLTSGDDEETEAALRARLLERIRQPPQGGSAADYVRWAKEVSGVTRAWAYSGWTGPGKVGLAFVMDGRSDIIPLEADAAEVAAHIEPLRPVSAALVVIILDRAPLALTISLPGGSDTVKAAIVAEVQDFLRRSAQPDGVISISDLREAVFIGAGDATHTLVAPNANVTTGPGEIATLGAVTWTA